jgi:hypothetical protein
VSDNIPAGTHLTVIIRDDSPLIHCGDTPSYRRVTIGLDAHQVEQIMLKPTCKNMGKDIFESVSRCFLEE